MGEIITKSRTIDEGLGFGKREAQARAQVFVDFIHHLTEAQNEINELKK